ncbi:FAD-dependent oxidoreductase (plasmid) [Agrobacterium larrymoorei]|uniref:FAD-dependent oxidoreductase n=1 Tax=Agrobacterium larrymoorei TaxID=160699 RepID=A0A4D7E1N4_9HYPH|nr:FAD-dependent oxidoreductase [Agrobacterium larrymoorei]QYA10420.1 FAD-dependent oxidoreductase [Agrobacterium larrymoorei]
MFDYIVVGGGSAGCVVASRLCELPDVRVLLLEKGPSDWNPYIHMPAMFYKTGTGNLVERYHYVDGAGTNNRNEALTMVQARVLGGGSSVNGMVYVRGTREDYDIWEANGASGWGYDDILPYYRKAEDNDQFHNNHHGVGGPLKVSQQRNLHPLSKQWLLAAQEAGIPYVPDFNTGAPAGCGPYQITARGARRSSTAVSYLSRAKKTGQLDVRTNCTVRRVVIAGNKATGVEYERGGNVKTVRCRHEVVLSAGAITSPKLLMLSGIGSPGELASHGIEVVNGLAGVGKNLHDHVEVSLVYDLNNTNSFDRYKRLHWQILAGLQYLLFQSGPITSNIIETGAFWYTKHGASTPDIQLFFLPGVGVEEGMGTTSTGCGCTSSISLARPKSRGYVGLRSADPKAPPIVDPNYLSNGNDLETIMDGMRIADNIMQQPSMKGQIARRSHPKKEFESEDEVKAFLYDQKRPGLHVCGTCRIGDDVLGVVDKDLQVRGISGLRVADASVIPSIVSANTNAVSIMIGEKAADHIKASHRGASIRT